MIVTDKSVYLDYVQSIKNKVDKICEKTASTVMSNAVTKIRARIFAKILLITELANQEVGFIPNSDWIKYKNEIDGLYEQLVELVNGRASHSKISTNIR